MTQVHSEVVGFLRERENPLDPPGTDDRIRDHGPVVRLRLADAQLGWIVLGQAEARTMLTDPRFSARRAPGPVAVRADGPELVEEKTRRAATGVDPSEHSRYRRLLGPHFSPGRVAALESRVEEVTAIHLDAMIKAGPPADLVTDFAAPVSTQIICELLGVSYDDRHVFWSHARTLTSIDTPRERLLAHHPVESAFMPRYVDVKRRAPGDDLLSVLADPAAGLTDDELTGVVGMLLMAGHEQPTNMIALAVLTLLEHPEQLERLRRRPERLDAAVDELLRYLSSLHLGTPRITTVPVELGGQVIQPGEVVIAAPPTTDRDPDAHPDPDVLDLARPRTDHLAFGHGIHHCLGQHLTRVELRATLIQLLARVPTLSVAVPRCELRFRHDMFIYGVHELPVTWTDVR